MTQHHSQLDNGLHLVGEHIPSARSLAAGYFVRTGSRDETPALSGVSHFLEHMMFKGTDRRTALDVNREFDEIGAQYNAFTSEENTVYYGAVLPQFQERLIDLLTDMMRPSLRQEDFDMEKNVILEEIALYEDRPQFKVMDEARQFFHGNHPLGYSVLGTTASIGALTRDAMLEYFRQRYAPDNLHFVITGQYDWEAVRRQLEDLTADWQPSGADRELSTSRPRSGVHPLPTDRFQRAHICFVAPGVPSQDDQRFAADLLTEAVGSGRGSRLYWELVASGLAQTARLYHSEEDHVGAYFLYAECDAERAQEVTDRIRSVLRDVTDQGLESAELERAKRKAASGLTVQGETPFGRLCDVGFNWVYRHEQVSLDRTVDDYLSVELCELNAMLADSRPFDEPAIVVLSPSPDLH